MARAVLFDRHPLERIVRWRTVANVLSTGFRRAQMLPVLCWEVVEGEQSFAIFGQAFDRLLIFDGVDFDERVECDESILLGISSNARLALACWLFGNFFKTLAVLCTQQR